MRELDKTKISIVVVALLHLVGILGLSFESTQTLFLQLTCLNLLITFGLFVWANEDYSGHFITLILACSFYGFIIEVIGVQTGVLFGIYEYGWVLGYKVMEVPLLIGINWFMVSILAAGVARRLTTNVWIQIVLGALLTLLLDIPMEPVAMKLDFWSWEQGIIPMQNYVMWFVTALIIHALIAWRSRSINQPLSVAFYLIQFLFFVMLNITLGSWSF